MSSVAVDGSLVAVNRGATRSESMNCSVGSFFGYLGAQTPVIFSAFVNTGHWATHKSEKDRLAEEIIDRGITFQMALSNRKKYPAGEFTAFPASVKSRPLTAS